MEDLTEVPCSSLEHYRIKNEMFLHDASTSMNECIHAYEPWPILWKQWRVHVMRPKEFAFAVQYSASILILNIRVQLWHCRHTQQTFLMHAFIAYFLQFSSRALTWSGDTTNSLQLLVHRLHNRHNLKFKIPILHTRIAYFLPSPGSIIVIIWVIHHLALVFHRLHNRGTIFPSCTHTHSLLPAFAWCYHRHHLSHASSCSCLLQATQ